MRLSELFNRPQTNESNDPCWKGYKQIGMKKKGKKKVPNCVPEAKDERPDYVVKASDKPKISKPTTGGESPHPYQGSLVGATEEYEITLEDTDNFHEYFGELAYSIDESDMFEAEYQGRKVKLNKPMRGDVKKFKVYVKNEKGNVIKVNFGHGGTSADRPTMRIRKSNPKARKSFRARHNCDNPGPKTKARYWSCRAW